MKRKGLLVLCGSAVAASAIVVAICIRKAPEPLPVAGPSPEASARLKLQGALRDASLLDLIRNARVATRKGDSVTREAMLTGLKREPQRARDLIKTEISKSNDSADVAILNRMMQEMP
jgi:hypothetical protein